MLNTTRGTPAEAGCPADLMEGPSRRRMMQAKSLLRSFDASLIMEGVGSLFTLHASFPVRVATQSGMRRTDRQIQPHIAYR